MGIFEIIAEEIAVRAGRVVIARVFRAASRWHYSRYLCRVDGGMSEIIFRPWLRASMYFRLHNDSDVPIRIRRATLTAVMRRGLSDGRFDDVPFVTFQAEPGAEFLDQLVAEPAESVAAWAHFERRDFEPDALRFFRLHIAVGNRKPELFRLQVVDAHSAHIGQSTCRVISPPPGILGDS